MRNEPMIDAAAGVTDLLLAWYRPDRRRFAFRRTVDPWAVLVSEVMLQQTQAGRVENHWSAFMSRFPTPSDLARASAGDVLRAWQGLGYNRRALALHRAAVAIVERHGGAVPGSLAELEALPAVGGYTARAVGAICFGLPVAALDTNIRRVVGRVVHGHGRPGDPGPAPSPLALQTDADALLADAEPRDWTLAAMDLGATVCRPLAPRCGECPLQAVCRYGRDAVGAGSSEMRRARGVAERAVPFGSTRRWLRGRLVDRLRGEPAGAWVRFDGPVGSHDQAAVASALEALVREGLVEQAEDGSVRLPG